MPPEPFPAIPPDRLRRLPGRSPMLRPTRYAPTARLWLDGQQLIQESLQRYTQGIQRFALADIQAIQIRRTVRGMVYNIVLAALLVVALLITWGALRTDVRGGLELTGEHLIVTAIVAAPFLLLLFINTVRGPTCRAVLTTALGPQPLSSLSRMRPARRALDAIIANAEAIQGTLRPEEAAQQVDRAQQGQRPAGPPPPAPGPGPAAPLPGDRY